MNCQYCGTPLATGAQICPKCGAATPNNAPYYSGQPQVDPTIISNPSNPYGGTPPTVYGSSPNNYGAQPNLQNPYEAPPPPPMQYGAPPQNAYGAPVAPPQYLYSPQQQPGGFGVPPQQPKRRSRLGLIIGIVAALVVVVVIVIIVLAASHSNNNNTSNTGGTATTTTQATATTSSGTTPTTSTTSGTSPSGNAIDPTAASIISHIQTASAIDSNDNPTTLANTFAVNQKVYITYNLNMGGGTGYVEVKWYVAGQFGKSYIFNANDPTYTHGYFSETYNIPTQGEAELYWCTQSNCSDAALAGYIGFTISGSGLHLEGQSPLAFSMPINRRNS
jgi:hypothetical protein